MPDVGLSPVSVLACRAKIGSYTGKDYNAYNESLNSLMGEPENEHTDRTI